MASLFARYFSSLETPLSRIAQRGRELSTGGVGASLGTTTRAVRTGANTGMAVPSKGGFSFENKPKIKVYPVPGEAGVHWSYRQIAHGGFVDQQMSAYQMKLFWPYAAMYPARMYAIFARMANDYGPVTIFFFLYITISFIGIDIESRNKYWY